MQHNISVLTAIILLLFTTSNVNATDEDPGKIVKQTVNEVLMILGNNNLNEKEKRSNVYEIAGQRINFKGMSRSALTVNWNKSSDEQKRQFQSLFTQVLLDSYWSRLKHYKGERVEYITGRIEGNVYATIDTVIISDKIEIPITYRMELIDDKWMAYDFLVESISLVTNFRIEYRNIIKLHGINGLLTQLKRELVPEVRADKKWTFKNAHSNFGSCS